RPRRSPTWPPSTESSVSPRWWRSRPRAPASPATRSVPAGCSRRWCRSRSTISRPAGSSRRRRRAQSCSARSSRRSSSPRPSRSPARPSSCARMRPRRCAASRCPSTGDGPPSSKRRPAMRTVSIEDAVSLIPDGASLMVGGFMGVGTPERLIDELVRQHKRNLVIIANDTAVPGRGIGKLVGAGLVANTVASHIGLNPETQQQMMAKTMAVELVPQGTLVERIRAGGCGLGGVLTPTGVGTIVEASKQRIEVNGKSYLLETALRADFALVHAFLADYLGNLSYALTARNFNPVIAMAADTVIVTAEHIVPVGVIAPDHVVTPAPIVDYLVINE